MSEYGSLSSHARRDRDDFRSGGGRSPPRSGNHGSADSDCILSLRNLAWSVTEDDLIQEFPRAINAIIKLDDRNRSSGCGTLTFANSTDCRNAEAECADKEINGRSVRAKIGTFPDRPRDDGYRGRGGFGRGGSGGMGRDGDRPYYDRYNGGGGGRRGGGDGMAPRRFDDGGYGVGNDRRSYGNDGGYGGQRRGSFGGRGGGFGGRDGGGGFGGRDGGGAGDRDRSPGRRRGGSGPRGGGGAPRITSAVIRRVAGDSSDSDFDNRR